MDAELAIEMGIPIYAIVALTSTATDKEGRSVPAPGQGILTTGREARGANGERACVRACVTLLCNVLCVWVCERACERTCERACVRECARCCVVAAQ